MEENKRRRVWRKEIGQVYRRTQRRNSKQRKYRERELIKKKTAKESKRVEKKRSLERGGRSLSSKREELPSGSSKRKEKKRLSS